MRKIILIITMLYPVLLNAQGKAYNFLIGHNTIADQYTTAGKGRLVFSSATVDTVGETRKMGFRITQGNIADENGNLLMVSNGCWIADASGDTMQNGDSLNPNSFTDDYCDPNSAGYGALPLPHGNIFLPFPGSYNKYILFHQTGSYSNPNLSSTELYCSTIDLSLNGGLGAVINKNQIILTDVISWGIAACKHANGRDWWIVAIRENSTLIHKFLLDTSGVNYFGSQTVGFPLPPIASAAQSLFSPDGKKFAYGSGQLGVNAFHDIRLFDFNRCSGNFSGLAYININDSSSGSSFAFSPDSKYLYHASFKRLYQINTDSTNIPASLQAIANNDVFASPVSPFYTNFFLMYLAANGKIYISSGNGVVDYHYINYPDSGGVACDVHLHDLHLPCYSFRGNVYHPNYYLGCDTTSGCACLTIGINELRTFDFKFALSPNPTNGNIKIMYLLPQNSKGFFEVFDVTGKKVFRYSLPPWSTLQNFDLNFLSGGIYSCVITSSNLRVSKKLAVIKN